MIAVILGSLVGCSGSSGSGSTGSTGSTGGSGGTGSTGGTGGGGTVTMTGPYAYSGPATPSAFTISSGGHTEVTINMALAHDVIGVTALLLTAPIATQTYATSDFGQFGLGVTEPGGTDMVTDSTDSISLTVSSLGANNSGEQDIHGTVSIAYHGTQALPDGGQASGAGTVDATF